MTMPPLSLVRFFEEDSAVTTAAEATGMEVYRRQSVVISDPDAIKAAGLVRETPDYPRILRLLKDGVEVPGASLGPIEYTLRHRAAEKEGGANE
jgi:hypothetical protein